jgi:hypothetical protein
MLHSASSTAATETDQVQWIQPTRPFGPLRCKTGEKFPHYPRALHWQIPASRHRGSREDVARELAHAAKNLIWGLGYRRSHRGGRVAERSSAMERETVARTSGHRWHSSGRRGATEDGEALEGAGLVRGRCMVAGIEGAHKGIRRWRKCVGRAS